jgi:hypothetical protein
LRGAGVAPVLALLCACEDPAGGATPVTTDGYSDDGPYVLRDATAESGLAGFQQVNGSSE